MIYWDLRRAEEHPGLLRGEAPAGLLSAPEQVFLKRLALPKRRQEWILGRYAVKALCRAWLAEASGPGGEQPRRPPPPASALTVAAAPDGSPYVLLAGAGPLPLTVSLSHRAGAALAALVPSPGAPLGADLELCEPHGAPFVEDFFTPAEAAAVAAAEGGQPRDRVATEIWSLKEAALKALRVGLRADTRAVEAQARPFGGEAFSRVALRLDWPGAPARAEAFVCSRGPLVVALTRLDAPAGEQPEPSAALQGYPALGERGAASAAA